MYGTEPPQPPELALLVGLQGSGKTSFFRARFAGTHALVSKDLFPHHRNKARRQLQLIEEALRAGRSVVLDNTNPRVEDRADPIALARSLGAGVTGYLFVTDVASALERNRQRVGRARVPDLAIYATAKRLQRPTPAEGFDRLFTVRLAPGGGYDVTPTEEDGR